MKYLIIASVLAVVVTLIYRRIRPYIQLFKKIAKTASQVIESNETKTTPRNEIRAGRKLIRCVACGTWVPASRSLKVGSGSSVYCSPECIETSSQASQRQRAG